LGQQQLLLIVLGVIVVGVAIVFAITMFRQSAIDNKRDLLINECGALADLAIAYYKKPKMLGGGEWDFTGWQIPRDMVTTATGSFAADVTSDKVIITGTGNEVVTGNDSISVKITIIGDAYSTEIIR
jgi:hypothetical protein